MKRILLSLLIFTMTSCAYKVGNRSKNVTIAVVRQNCETDTLSVNACEIWLYRGDLYYMNDTDYYHGDSHVLASGVYKFETIK